MGTSLSLSAYICDSPWVWLAFLSVRVGMRNVCPSDFCLLQQSLLIMNHTTRVVWVLPSCPTSCIYSQDCNTDIKLLNCENIVKAGQCFLGGCGIWKHEYMAGYMWKVVFSRLVSWDRWIGHGVCCWHLLAVRCLARSSKLLGTSGQGIPARQDAILFL